MQILYSQEHFGWSLNHSKRGREKICKEFLYKDFITMSDLEILCKVISYAFLLSTLWVNYLNIWPKNFLQDKCTCFFHKHSKISEPNMAKGGKLHNFNDSTKKSSTTLTSDLNLISWSFYSLFTSESLH